MANKDIKVSYNRHRLAALEKALRGRELSNSAEVDSAQICM